MTKKQKIIQLLEENKGAFLSGTKIAEHLNISRNGVWKYIHQLREEDFLIDGVSNQGYRLNAKGNKITKEGIKLQIDSSFYHQVILLDKVESTNDFAKQIAIENKGKNTVILALEQIKGRGRRGRTFYSPKDKGVYCSILLYPPYIVKNPLLLTNLISVAVSKTIEFFQPESIPQIKWVNDILIEGKKVCGILTEGTTNVENGELQNIVIGIGVNLIKDDDLPQELRKKVGFLFSETESNRNIWIGYLLNEIQNILEKSNWTQEIQYYQEHCILLGKKIKVIMPNDIWVGTVKEITKEGTLLVQNESGVMKELSSGEISIQGDFYA